MIGLKTRMGKTRQQIENIFYPKSVAVVGTNRVKGTVPYDILYNILRDGFQGIVYPVSPREKSIAGVKAYKYVIDIEDEVDLAIIVFPSSVCHLAMEQCGKKGIKGAIIISAGFREIGEVGLEREKRIREIADRYGMSFVGPNCLGVINTDPSCSLNASFARKMPAEGRIAFLSQSGALCTAVLDYAQSKSIGFSKFVSFGNKADITEIDLLYYLKDDPQTEVILLYLEEVSDGRALMKAAQSIISETGKPILALKSGRTSAGASAASLHTGSLAGSDAICDAAFRQAGIIRCDTIDDLFNFAIALAYQPLPRGNRIAIVTNAGGPGVLATDMAIKEELVLAKLSQDATKALRSSLPKTANIHNPIDVIGDAKVDRYRVALQETLQDEGVDGVLVILTPQSMTDIKGIAEEVCRNAVARSAAPRQLAGRREAGKEDVRKSGLRRFTGTGGTDGPRKPLYASFLGEAEVSVGTAILQARDIPHYQRLEDMCRAFARAYSFYNQLERKPSPPLEFNDVGRREARAVIEKASGEGRAGLSSAEAMRVVGAYGIPMPSFELAFSESDAGRKAEAMGFPVVMAANSSDIMHKFDIGAVALDIGSRSDAETAYRTIHENVRERSPEAHIEGVIVRPWIPSGQEVILGIKRDASFGPVVIYGLGGIFVEVFRDVCFRVAPFGPDEAHQMVAQTMGYSLLAGARGRPVGDIAAIVDCILRLSQLGMQCPEIEELDINPLIVHERGRGCSAADVKIMIQRSSK